MELTPERDAPLRKLSTLATVVAALAALAGVAWMLMSWRLWMALPAAAVWLVLCLLATFKVVERVLPKKVRAPYSRFE